MKNHICNPKLYSHMLLALTILIFITAIINNGPIYSGDSLQYLKMAFKASNCELPITDKWMPLYSLLISFIHKVLKLSLIHSAIFINSILFTSLCWTIYLLNAKLFSNNLILLFLSLSLIALNSNFLLFSLSILAELPMLLSILVFFVVLFNKISKNYLSDIDVAWLSVLVLFGIFTKYNGLILITVLIISIFLLGDLKKLIRQSVIVFCITLIPYFIWGAIKSDDELIILIGSENSFFQNLTINLKDLYKTSCEFYFPIISGKLILSISVLAQSILGALFLVIISALAAFEYLYRKNRVGLILLIFTLLYISSFIYLSSTSDINEVNQRTMIYPFSTLLLYLLFNFYNLKNKKFKSLIFMLFTILFVLNSMKFKDVYNNLLYKKVGVFNKSFYSNKNQTLSHFFTLINNNLQTNQVHTNENKLLPIYLNYELMYPLPTNDSWIGNLTIKKDSLLIMKEILSIKKQIRQDSHIIIFLGEQFEEIYKMYYKIPFQDTTLFTTKIYSDGFLIYKK